VPCVIHIAGWEYQSCWHQVRFCGSSFFFVAGRHMHLSSSLRMWLKLSLPSFHVTAYLTNWHTNTPLQTLCSTSGFEKGHPANISKKLERHSTKGGCVLIPWDDEHNHHHSSQKFILFIFVKLSPLLLLWIQLRSSLSFQALNHKALQLLKDYGFSASLTLKP